MERKIKIGDNCYMGDIGLVVPCSHCREEIEIPDKYLSSAENDYYIISKEYKCPCCGNSQ